MKNPSLESIYSVIEKRILFVEGFTEIPNLSFIIKSCRLKPYSYFFEKRTNKIILDKWWFDEYGNSLTIKNKKVNIIYGDLRLNRNSINSTDLYYGLEISKIIKISTSAYIVFGTDEDLYQDFAIISFLGIDNYLRTFLYYYDEWQQVSPLMLGMDALSIIARYKNKKCCEEFGISKKTVIPCARPSAWLTYLPISNDLLTKIDQQCSSVARIFKH